ncbi:uncharacterized protein LOC113377676 [Ctenocephalides felis]|uniref:uncharacterized protein LOC113377676 n=1 Tax=Ctenocephalides felis TaxID=7515 RepID=UPI000E6E23B1|nr:uncharacterized protein LOC113377676 [Ctenocephalides felis]
MASNNLVLQVNPWYSSAEWRHVFRLVFSTEYVNRLEGLNYMKMWKVRTSHLSGGIQGTMEILEAILYDENPDTNNVNNNRIKQIMYSMAIIRWLNLITDSTKYNTLYHTAQNLQIPDWIVSIRHEGAHSAELTSLTLLREASQYALKWLYEMYWKLENEDMVDYIIKESTCVPEEDNFKKYLDRILRIYDNVIMYIVEYKFKRICDINIPSLKEDLATDVDSLLMSPETYDSERCFLKSLLFIVVKRINQLIKDFKGYDKYAEVYVDSLLNCNHFLSRNILPNENGSYKEYVKLWMPLLDHLHVTNALSCLVKKLMDMSCLSKSNKEILACTWLEYILNGLVMCKSVQNITQTHYYHPPTVKRAIIEASAALPEKTSPIMFRPELPLDKFFLDIDALKYTLMNNSGVPSGKYWKILLNLMKEKVPSETISTIDRLQNLVNQECDIDYDKLSNLDNTERSIYTADDVIKFRLEHEKALQIDNAEQTVTVNGTENNKDDNPDVIWKEVDDNIDWSTIPFGALPSELQTS